MAEAAATPMTQDQLKSLVSDAVKDSVAAQVAAALEPLTKSTTDTLDAFKKSLKPSPEAHANDIEATDKEMGKYRFGRKARALALAAIEGVSAKDPDAVAHCVKAAWRPSLAESTLKWLGHVKGLTVGSSTAAGDMIFPEYDLEWIELLRNNTVVRGNCRTVPMPRGATSRRKQTGASTATYQGELGPIAVSNQTVGRVNLSYKKLTGATVVSNDLIRFSGAEADRFVQEDLLKVNGLREDRAFLVGNPPTDAGSPQGIRYQTAAGNIAATAGTSLANFQTDGTNLIKLVQSNNVGVTPQNAGFIWSVSTFWTIYALTTTTGDWVFKAGLEAARPTFLGFPVYLTTQLEVGNSFIGANAGLNMFVHWPSMEIHDSMSRTVEAFRGGAYHDGSTIQSGISNDETVITCISEHDFLQVYDVAASIRTGLAT
jgi:HK97 family phage major capsid protein